MSPEKTLSPSDFLRAVAIDHADLTDFFMQFNKIPYELMTTSDDQDEYGDGSSASTLTALSSLSLPHTHSQSAALTPTTNMVTPDVHFAPSTSMGLSQDIFEPTTYKM